MWRSLTVNKKGQIAKIILFVFDNFCSEYKLIPTFDCRRVILIKSTFSSIFQFFWTHGPCFLPRYGTSIFLSYKNLTIKFFFIFKLGFLQLYDNSIYHSMYNVLHLYWAASLTNLVLYNQIDYFTIFKALNPTN